MRVACPSFLPSAARVPTFAPMPRVLFILALALYGFGAMDLHEWVHVPKSIGHWLEHHTDFGHHDGEGAQHHDEHGDHDPFGCDDHDMCTAFSFVGQVNEKHTLAFILPAVSAEVSVLDDEGGSAAHSGSKWNPPKLG